MPTCCRGPNHQYQKPLMQVLSKDIKTQLIPLQKLQSIALFFFFLFEHLNSNTSTYHSNVSNVSFFSKSGHEVRTVSILTSPEVDLIFQCAHSLKTCLRAGQDEAISCCLLSILRLRFLPWLLGSSMPISRVILFAVPRETSDSWAVEGTHLLPVSCNIIRLD